MPRIPRRLTLLGALVCLLAVIAAVLAATAADATIRPAAVRTVHPESFGARGDGRTDDTRALQRAFDSAGRGTVVALAPRHVYLHSAVLHLRNTGMHLAGQATLLATREAESSVWIEADSVVVDGVTFRTAHTTRRWSAWEQMGVRVRGHAGIVMRHVTVDGSAAAGIYVGNAATHFLLDHVVVRNTRADGIHMTMGSNHGQVVAPTVSNTGDDAVAVVSYSADGTPCHDIVVTAPRVLGTRWGRGLSVVGGTNIVETGIDVRNTSAAAVYVAAEGSPWFTAAPRHVVISGGRISGANTSRTVDHGAVLVVSGETGPTPVNVTISGLTISNTRSSATRTFGVVSYGTPPSGILFQHLRIVGGPRSAYEGNSPSSTYRYRDVVRNGVRLADHG